MTATGEAARRSRSRSDNVVDESTVGIRIFQPTDLRAAGAVRYLHSHQTSCQQDLLARM